MGSRICRELVCTYRDLQARGDVGSGEQPWWSGG